MFYGFRVGPLCTPCAVEAFQKWRLKISPLIREMRESMDEHFRKIEAETGAKVETVDVPKLLEPRCKECDDLLTGHEDDSATLCRWCVTCKMLVHAFSHFANQRRDFQSDDARRRMRIG